MKKHSFGKLILCISLSLTLTLLCAIMLTLSLVPAQIASAIDSEFTQVYPLEDYFQASSPSKVSANRTYLIIFDNTAKKLFVRSNSSVSTRSYSADFDNVDNVFAIGNTAFLNDGGSYYTLNLADESATWQSCALSSPANIKFFNTDGTHLYAHSASGAVSVYDENLSVAFDTDNLQEDEFSGLSTVVMGENDCLYVFSIETGTPFFMTYNVTTKQKSERVYIKGNSLIAEAYVGDVIYALKNFDGAKNIVCIDKTNGTELFATDISPDAFFAYGDKLYTIKNNAVTVYTLNADKTALNRNSTVTMSGSDEGHFDNPTDIIKYNGNIIVADSNNKRLQTISGSNVTSVYFDFKPLCITNNANDVYVGFENAICKVSNGKIVATYSAQGVIDVVYHDKLYVLTSDGLYVLLGGNLVKFFDINNAKRVTCAKDGTNVYLLTDDKIVTISTDGKELPSLASDDFTNAVDFAIDYEGKATVVFEKGYNQYLGKNKQEYTLSSSTLNATVLSAYLDGTSLYFTAKECFVGKTSVNAITKDTYTFDKPQITKENAYSFATPKDNALYYSADERVENTLYANKETVLVYDDITVDESGNYRYARVGSKLVKIAINDFNKVEPNALNGDYVLSTQATLYTSPYCSDGTITLEKGERVALISDVCGYDKNGWYIVEYNQSTYFVRTNCVEEYVVVTPKEDKIYGKANADRVGGIVNVYAEQSTSSNIIAEILDGDKVEVLETYDDFYLVSIDGKVGYVKKNNVKLDGLTTVQIVAIVLAIIVALAGSAIFASIYLTRKNAENKKEEEKVQKRF